ncbi:hypothetical protein PG984_009225 [Apiospora sp. TS-2023a]
MRQRLRPTEGGQAEVLGRMDELVQDELRKAEQLVRLDARRQVQHRGSVFLAEDQPSAAAQAHQPPREVVLPAHNGQVYHCLGEDLLFERWLTRITYHLERTAVAHKPVQRIHLLMPALLGKLQQAVKGLAVAYLDGALQLPGAAFFPRGPRQQR